MKRMGLLLGLVAVIALVTVGSALAAEGKTKGAGGRPPIGEITKIDGKTLTVSVKAEGAAATDVTGTVDESTEITKAEAAKAEALKVGDNVRITQGDKRASGEITKIEGKTLTVKGRRGEESITLDDTPRGQGQVRGPQGRPEGHDDGEGWQGRPYLHSGPRRQGRGEGQVSSLLTRCKRIIKRTGRASDREVRALPVRR